MKKRLIRTDQNEEMAEEAVSFFMTFLLKRMKYFIDNDGVMIDSI